MRETLARHIVRDLVTALDNAGIHPSGVDDGSMDTPIIPVSTVDGALEIIFSVDHSFVYFGDGTCWFWVILENGEDVISDWGTGSPTFERIITDFFETSEWFNLSGDRD